MPGYYLTKVQFVTLILSNFSIENKFNEKSLLLNSQKDIMLTITKI